MEIVSSVASTVTELLFDPIVRQIDYIRKYNSNIQTLRDDVEMLKAEEQELRRQVEAAQRNGENIKAVVGIWMRRAGQIAADADIILHQNETASKTCFIRLCPNFKSRHQLGRMAAKQIPVIAKVRGENVFKEISYHGPPQGIVPVKSHQGFGSRESVLEDIVQALKDADTSSVGVCGMGGVGKTTLVKEVASRITEQGIFKVVVMARVTHNPVNKDIQQEIADRLGYTFMAQSVSVRADELKARLKKEEKILVILDDIWSEINLEDIGIPCGTEWRTPMTSRNPEDVYIPGETERRTLMTSSNPEDADIPGETECRTLMTCRNPEDADIPGETECRILMTSRNRNVLSKMNVKKVFQLHVLKDEEAWTLFEETVGKLEDEEVRRKAFEVAKKCSGLPILIVTVAAALRDKELAEWSDAIRWLKRFGDDDIDERVKSALELSYNHLKGDEIKSLFLLCAQLPPHNINVRELLRYSVGLNLFKQINTLESVKDRLHKLINDLKASCMLLEGDERGSFKMHEVIHNFAISVASKECQVFTVSYDNELEEWPEKNKLQQYTAISLPSCKMPGFPAEFSCPKLKSLLLHSEGQSQKVPDIFFSGMQQLEVMALKCIYLSPLPSSLGVLQNLQTLCLDHCVLGNMAMVGELKNLRVLSFMGSNIVQLPIELRQLNCLRLLDLTNCSSLKVIPPDLLSSFSQLEDLYMGNSFCQWDEKGEQNASLTELKALSKLVTLDLHIVDAKILPRDLFSGKLKGFRIFIGDKWYWSDEYEISKTLKLNFNIGINQLLVKVKELLKITEDLYLHELTGSTNVLYELDWEGFTRLKHLHVQNSPGIQYLVDSSGMCPHVAFPKLESLFLYSLINLEKICRSPLMSEAFRNLSKLNVRNCNRLKNLFTFSMASGLGRLEEINVSGCQLMEEIISGEIGEDEALEFPKLHVLTLEYLPQISSFSSQSKPLPSAASREIVSQDDEPEPALPFFNSKIKFPNLADLKLSSITVEKMWSNQLADLSSRANKLSTLIVDGCENLKYLLSSRMIESFAQLKKLEICDCKSMEKIIATHGSGGGEMTTAKIRFGKLEFLKLKKLPQLVNFCTCSFIECPSLKVLRIGSCPELKTFIANSSSTEGEFGETNSALLDEKVAFSELEELHIMDMHKLKHVWKWNIEDPTATISFARLETLEINDCSVLEEIVLEEETAKTTPKFVFPQLKTLHLRKLEQLKSFCSESHTLRCPKLQNSTVYECKKLKIFYSQAVKDMQSSTNMTLFSSIELNNFNSGSGVARFPILKAVNIVDCPITFASAILRLPESLKADEIAEAKIWSNQLIELSQYIQNLTTLIVDGCGNLNYLFTSSMVKNLAQLKKLEICNYRAMEEIIATQELGEETVDNILFPKLEFLKIKCLPKLTRFFTGNFIKCPSLKVFHIESCRQLKRFFSESLSSNALFDQKVAFPMLEQLHIKYMHKLTMIWNDEFQADSLKVLKIEHANALLKIFSTKMLRGGFWNLEKLVVNNCDLVEEVFDDLQVTVAPASPRTWELRSLDLRNLPNLKHVWKWNNEDPTSTVSFAKLGSIFVWNCRSLKTLFPATIARNLQRLKVLYINGCSGLEEVVLKEETAEAAPRFVFPRMEYLLLWRLEHLKCFLFWNSHFRMSNAAKVDHS